MEWISVKDKMPGLVDDEPEEVALLTDEIGEQEGYYEYDTWWIKLRDPMVGHQDSNTFSIDINVTHWKPIIAKV